MFLLLIVTCAHWVKKAFSSCTGISGQCQKPECTQDRNTGCLKRWVSILCCLSFIKYELKKIINAFLAAQIVICFSTLSSIEKGSFMQEAPFWLAELAEQLGFLCLQFMHILTMYIECTLLVPVAKARCKFICFVILNYSNSELQLSSLELIDIHICSSCSILKNNFLFAVRSS